MKQENGYIETQENQCNKYLPDLFVLSKNGKNFVVIIIKAKNSEEYRIVNVNKKHLSDCVFTCIEDAIRDIFRYNSEGRNEIVTEGIYYNSVLDVFGNCYTVNNRKELWL